MATESHVSVILVRRLVAFLLSKIGLLAYVLGAWWQRPAKASGIVQSEASIACCAALDGDAPSTSGPRCARVVGDVMLLCARARLSSVVADAGQSSLATTSSLGVPTVSRGNG